MQSSELGEMLNLKVRGPRMFDDDGRVVTTERIKVKEKDSPEEAGKELATELQNQMRMLIEQADNEVRKAQKDHEKAIQEDNENKKIQAETNVEEKGTLRQNINNVNISISALLPILRDAVR